MQAINGDETVVYNACSPDAAYRYGALRPGQRLRRLRSIISSTRNCSKTQARQIVKTFFDAYTPRSFDISHKASRSNMKYALGQLNAGGEVFVVTIFVSSKADGTYQIQQFKIDRQTAVY